MLRRLINIVCCALLLLSIATGVLWIRSQWRLDQVKYTGAETAAGDLKVSIAEFSSNDGIIEISMTRLFAPGEAELERLYVRGWQYNSAEANLLWPQPPGLWKRLGFEWKHSSGKFGSFAYELHQPHWAVIICLSAGPALVIFGRSRIRRRARIRLERGLCVRCGYDMRATPATCPECGAAAPS